MQKNSQNFSMQEAMRLANSDAGQRLLAILKQSDGDQLRKAMDQDAAGNYEGMQSALSSVLASQEVQALLKELGG
jgi:hypothetical protein